MKENKEKTDRQVILKVQPSLFGAFREKCKGNYKKVSEVIRELMLEYIRRKDEVD